MNKILHGDAHDVLRTLPARIAHTCITSPPYFGLRNYGVDGQLGLENTPETFVERLIEIFREVRRVLRDDGTCWINMGDSYFAPKNLLGMPWRVAFALQADGWYLRQDLIWHKPNPMPERVRDRCVRAHEYLFLLSKSPRYFFDTDAIREPCQDKAGAERYRKGNAGRSSASYDARKWTERSDGVARPPITMTHRTYHPLGRNRRSVWTVSTKPFRGAHFATFPPDLVEPCILASAPANGIVLDPFIGSGTTAAVALRLGRRYLGIELNPEYVKLAQQSIKQAGPATAA